MREAGRALEREGWEVVELPSCFTPIFTRCCFLFLTLISWDGGQSTISKLFGEDVEENLKV